MQDEYLTRCVVDPVQRSFRLLSNEGDERVVECNTVDEFMSENPEYLNPEDPLAYALNKMHVGGFRHVPIVDDSLKPVGLISITNVISTIADYFSMEIINLPPLDRIIDSSKQEGG